MYTTIIRQYEVSGVLKTYGYYYEGDEKSGTQLAQARCEAEVADRDDNSWHRVRLAEVGAVCDRIAGNLAEPLF